MVMAFQREESATVGIFKPIKDIAAEPRGWLKLTALAFCDAYDTIDWT